MPPTARKQTRKKNASKVYFTEEANIQETRADFFFGQVIHKRSFS